MHKTNHNKNQILVNFLNWDGDIITGPLDNRAPLGRTVGGLDARDGSRYGQCILSVGKPVAYVECTIPEKITLVHKKVEPIRFFSKYFF